MMETRELAKIARIVELRSQLAAKKKELDGLVAQYIRLSPDVSWRKLARRIHMDYTQLYKFAKKQGLVADKEEESATARAREAVQP